MQVDDNDKSVDSLVAAGKKKGFGAPAAKPPPADLKKVREWESSN